MVQTMLTIMQIILAFGNICIMTYAFSKFLSKPHDDLTEKVIKLESKVEDIEDSLKSGDRHFREHDTTVEVIINTTLALIEYEIQNCYSENKPINSGLEEAKANLNNFLIRRNHGSEIRNN